MVDCICISFESRPIPENPGIVWTASHGVGAHRLRGGDALPSIITPTKECASDVLDVRNGLDRQLITVSGAVKACGHSGASYFFLVHKYVQVGLSLSRSRSRAVVGLYSSSCSSTSLQQAQFDSPASQTLLVFTNGLRTNFSGSSCE